MNPEKTFFCPCNAANSPCSRVITRLGEVYYDDHLASVHCDFRNVGGRGGELLDWSTKKPGLNRLSLPAIRFVASHRQGQVAAALQTRDDLLEAFKAVNCSNKRLEEAQLPEDMQPGEKDTNTMSKTAAMNHAILVRETLNAWDGMFTLGQKALEEAKKEAREKKRAEKEKKREEKDRKKKKKDGEAMIEEQ